MPNSPDPGRCDPVLWVLTDVLGLTVKEVSRRAQVPRGSLRSARVGWTLSAEHLRRMRALALQTVDAAYADVPDLRDGRSPSATPEPVRAYRRAVAAVVRWAVTPVDPRQAPRSTDLTETILANLGTAGERRSLVIARIRSSSVTTAFSVKRAARRLGVREELRRGHVWWIPPPDLPRIRTRAAFSPPRPEIAPPRSARGRRLRMRMVDELERRGHVPAADLVGQLTAEGFSRPAVYRCARDLCVVRETVGFGPSKVTLWSLPSQPDDELVG